MSSNGIRRTAGRVFGRLAVVVAVVAGAATAAAPAAFAGLDGPLEVNYDQHCVTQSYTAPDGTVDPAAPTDVVTVNVEAVDPPSADTAVIAAYSIPGFSQSASANGHFDTDRHNVTFTFDVPNPPAGQTLDLTALATWADPNTVDGPYSDVSFSPGLLACGAPGAVASTDGWDNFEAASFTQTCTTGTIHLRGGAVVRLTTDTVTVNATHGAPYGGTDYYVGRPAWAQYSLNGAAYEPAATGTFDSTDATTMSFSFLPGTGGDLNLLVSARDVFGRTDAAHVWAPVAC